MEEAFVQEELEMLLAAGVDLVAVPTRTRGGEPNDQSQRSGLAARTIGTPLASGRVLAGAARTLVRHPRASLVMLGRVMRYSGGRRNLATNLASFPKALWLANLVGREGVTHIHAYWLAHTSTMAMVAAYIARVPWSGTGYRWDIDAANALDLKARSAAFLRVADELGQRLVLAAVERAGSPCPVHLVRTGVDFPTLDDQPPVDLGAVCYAGAFVPKKGQGYLVDALAGLRAAGRPVTAHFFGDGPLRAQIEADIDRLGLGATSTFHGTVPLDELRQFLRTRRPIFVLPSIRADDGQEEGIPVVLIEAMATGCPVISTSTGSIPSLVLDGCGWLVADRDARALQEAITLVRGDPDHTTSVTAAARSRVKDEFDRGVTAARMAQLTGMRPGS